MTIRTSQKSRSVAAIAVFAAVYVAAMALLFMPKSFFVASPELQTSGVLQ